MRPFRPWTLAILCLAGSACAPPAGKTPPVAVVDASACGPAVPPEVRLTPAEIAALPSTGKPNGVLTTVLYVTGCGPSNTVFVHPPAPGH